MGVMVMCNSYDKYIRIYYDLIDKIQDMTYRSKDYISFSYALTSIILNDNLLLPNFNYTKDEAICSILTSIKKKENYDEKTVMDLLNKLKNNKNMLVRFLLEFSEKYNSASSNNVNLLKINPCMQDIISKNYLKCNHNVYNFGNSLYGCMDIGKRKKEQEDSITLLENINSGAKFIAVADGVSDSDNSMQASNFTIVEIGNWFLSLTNNSFENEVELQKDFNKKLSDINFKIKTGSTTFSGAIITDKYTIVTSIGDSRVYGYKNGVLYRLTKDQSLVMKNYYDGFYSNNITVDDLRFKEESNLITNAIGTEMFSTNETKLLYADYDYLMATSDGVTDCLSDRRIKNIFDTTSDSSIAERVVLEAVNTDSYSKKEDTIIHGGKDNTSAVVYIKRR